MTLRLVQPGEGQERDLFILFFADPSLDQHLRDALGTAPCIVATSTPKGSETMPTLLAWAAAKSRAAGWRRIALAGYSQGVPRLRTLLLHPRTNTPDAVLAIDGTHASRPPEKWQIDVWRYLATKATNGETLFVATHTYNTYTEQLRAPETPFLSTVNVLRQATGFPLLNGGPLDAPVCSSRGNLFVYSYASSSCDTAAHAAQLTHALPAMLRAHVAPLFRRDGATPSPTPAYGYSPKAVQDALNRHGATPRLVVDGIIGPKTKAALVDFQERQGLPASGVVDAATLAALDKPTGPEMPGWLNTAFGFGQRCVLWAQQYIGQTIETAGQNDGPLIREWFRACTRTGATGEVALSSLGVTHGEWCAAFACAAATASSLPGDVVPHGNRVSGIELRGDAIREGAWKTVDQIRGGHYRLRVGDIVLMQRGVHTWTTHVARVATVPDANGAYTTIGGNEDNTVRITPRWIKDPDLLGVIAYP